MRRLVLLILLTACSSGAEDDVRALLDFVDEAVSFDCDCFFEAEGFESPSACRVAAILSAEEKECFIDAVLPVANLNPSAYDCRRRSARDFLSCARSVGCDEVALDDCFRMTAVCPEDVCAGLTGDRFEDCQIEQARAATALERCERTEDASVLDANLPDGGVAEGGT